MSLGDHKFLPFRRRQTFGRDGNTSLLAVEKSLTNISVSTADSANFEEDGDENSIGTGRLGLNQLNFPTEPLVELVFVHGLGGGSRKSWSKSPSEAHFWPKSWLPRDPDFHNVRIHSFGYKSAKTEIFKAISGIPDYAQSLLSALRDSPSIRRCENAIILVGHSMGGLVIKKAFIQAHAIEAYRPLASRIRSLYFLGTPHQGSEFIGTFVNYFKGIPFVRTTENIKDLDPSSRLIEALNQEFPRCSQDIELRSFWETEQSKILTKHQYVVPKHSACLNYTNEISDGIDADHRGICKFERPTNPNFQKLRNALTATIDNILHQHATQNHHNYHENLRLLREFLRIREPPEDDLADRLATCLTDDTCAWFTTRKDYQNWRDISDTEHSDEHYLRDFVIMEAGPGAGKSVLSAQVINNLQALNCECSYYFFDAQDREKSSLSRLLRSLAFQMALLSPTVRHALLELQKQNLTAHDEDDKAAWRKLFTNCIFRLPSGKQHFWIIDGLDECQQSTTLLQMLFRLNTGTLPKIFMTTRPDSSIHNEIYAHQCGISCLHLSHADTQASIRTYIEARTSQLRLRKEQDRHDLNQALLNGAEGSFLWAKLTLDNIGRATGPQQIMESLHQIPKGMDHLYSRILKDLERDVSEDQRVVAKSVLNWAVCANPPLTVEEIEAAVKLDTESEIFADRMCEVLRNLILIDHSGKVRPVHQTTRSYLLKPDLNSFFAVSASDTHSRIADVLIAHLNQRLRNIRSSSQLIVWHQRKQGIDDYALLYFSEHIRRAGSNDHSLFIESDKFFSSSGVSWIACIALGDSLCPVIKTSQNLRSWLQARIKRTPPIGELARKTVRMEQWSVDLSRLVAKFGKHLLECPSAVYMLIPPFVPTESVLAISRPRPRDLTVIGFKNDVWDDRLCSKFHQSSTCTAVTSGKYNFAIGLKNGRVHIYDSSTMQLLRTLQHAAVVKLLKYNETGSQLLTAGFRKIMMWAIPEGHLLWQQTIREPRLAVEFLGGGALISISSQHTLIKQDATTGAVLHSMKRRHTAVELDGISSIFRGELQYAEFSKDADILATMERKSPILLTDIEDQYEIGTIELEVSDDVRSGGTIQRPITAMTLCANSDIALLAAAYRDGILAVFDRDLRLLAKRTDTEVSTLLAGSPNGLLLAAANVEGVITLYSFEDLTPLHTLFTKSIGYIKSLVFSGDGQRIIDIRDRQANVWTPAVLISRPTEDYHGSSELTLAPAVATSSFTGLKNGLSDITCVLPCSKADQFFVGRKDGSIAVHGVRDAQCITSLFEDPAKRWTSSLAWSPGSRILASVSGTSSIAVHRLAADWTTSTIFRQTLPDFVKQIFISEKDGSLRLFVVTTKTVELWTSSTDEADNVSLHRSQSHEFKREGLWVEDPSGVLLFAEPGHVCKYDWTNIHEPNLAQQLKFPSSHNESLQTQLDSEPERIAAFDRGASFLRGGRPTLFLRSVSSPNVTTALPSAAIPTQSSGRKRWLIDLSEASELAQTDSNKVPQPFTPTLSAALLPVSDLIEHVIGIRNNGKQLLFLNKNLWVCSYDWIASGVGNVRKSHPGPPLNTTKYPPEYSRHFFIPDDWISSNYSNANGQLLFVIAGAREDCLVFAKEHEVAVIKNPFTYTEKVST